MKAGEWRELTGTTGWDRDLIMKDVNGADGSTGATDWSDQLTWDPSTRQIRFLGLGHYRAWKAFAFYDSADTWAEIKPLPDPCMYTGGACIGHAYHRNTMDTDSGVHYFYNGGNIWRCDIRTNAWSSITVPSGYTGGFGDVAEYFPALKSIMHGIGGTVGRLDLSTGVWSQVPGTFSVGPYHNTGAISVRQKKFFYGGGNNSSAVYMVDTALDVTRLPDVPGILHVAFSTLTSDPVTGDVLYLSEKDTLYALDPENPAWVPLLNSPVPFAGHAMATPVSTYGVTLFAQPNAKLYLYKHALWSDTTVMASLSLTVPRTTVEQFLSTPLTSVVTFVGGREDTITYRTIYASLDPSVATVSAAGMVTGWKPGIVRITGQKKQVSDTIEFTIVSSTASVDSVRIDIDSLRFLAGDSFQVHATGYYHKDAEYFSRDIDTVAEWTSEDSGVATVERGFVRGVAAAPSVFIVAEHMGASDACRFTVWPRPDFIKRINFQISATPWKYGWLADNGGAYSAGAGYGWTSGAGSARDDRGGSNFLLKSFVIGNPGQFRMDAPDGDYIIKIGMGDNQYGTDSYNWTAQGADTICRKPVGTANGITIDTITVSGGFADFTVNGPINYLVMISSQGININTVADDGIDYVPPSSVADGPEATSATPALSASPIPFNPVVTIRYALPDARGLLCIYTPAGRLVRSWAVQGRGSLAWDGRGMTSGLYIARLVVPGSSTVCIRLLLLK